MSLGSFPPCVIEPFTKEEASLHLSKNQGQRYWYGQYGHGRTTFPSFQAKFYFS